MTGKNSNDTARRERSLAGELNVVSYSQKYHEVILVPVNRARCIEPQKAEAYLNSIYSQAVVQFRVLAVDSFFVALTHNTHYSMRIVPVRSISLCSIGVNPDARL